MQNRNSNKDDKKIYKKAYTDKYAKTPTTTKPEMQSFIQCVALVT